MRTGDDDFLKVCFRSSMNVQLAGLPWFCVMRPGERPCRYRDRCRELNSGSLQEF